MLAHLLRNARSEAVRREFRSAPAASYTECHDLTLLVYPLVDATRMNAGALLCGAHADAQTLHMGPQTNARLREHHAPGHKSLRGRQEPASGRATQGRLPLPALTRQGLHAVVTTARRQVHGCCRQTQL